MSTLPTISLITPSFNQGRFIDRTIQSVLSQNYPSLEYIVMDGGSNDETVEILKQYGGSLKWTSEKDEGQADAINKGLKMAAGDIVGYLNSDDLLEPGALLQVGKYFASHPCTMWLTGKCRIIDEQDQEVRRTITAYKNFLLNHYSYSLLLVTNPISQPATFWRRSVVEEIGLFDKTEHLVMDYDYWLKIGKRHPLLVANEYLASFRVYPTSKTSSSFLHTFKKELELSKKYTSSRALNALHRLSYAGITSVYFLLNLLGRLKHRP